MVIETKTGGMPRVWQGNSLACMTLECAYNLLAREDILPVKLGTFKAFREHVCDVYQVEVKHGMISMPLDSYHRLHRKLDPQKEDNGGRRSLLAWPGPKVAIGEYREDKRPRVDRRAHITTGWEVSPTLCDFTNNPYSRYENNKRKHRIDPKKPEPVKPTRIYKKWQVLTGTSQFEYLMEGSIVA